MCGAKSASHSLSVLYSWEKQRMWSMSHFAGQEECIDPGIEIQVNGPFFLSLQAIIMFQKSIYAIDLVSLCYQNYTI